MRSRRRPLALTSSLFIAVSCLAADSTPAPAPSTQWTDISSALVANLEANGQKPAWPGKSAGIAVDPSSGDVFLVIAGTGIYRSSDHGQTFARSDDKKIGGRCETGAAIQIDQDAGKRIACFMLDGTAGMTLDGGQTWTSFTNVGRNWDYGAVVWNEPSPTHIITMRHESGCEIFLTSDAGKKWNQIAKDAKYDGVGIFDPQTLILTKKDGGILRSTDAGTTWTSVADFAVTSHVVQIYKNVGYLIAKEGLLATRDRGATWTKCGQPLDATFGPVFKDEKTMIAWGKNGILESTDAGATWNVIAKFPDEYMKSNPAWFADLGWDSKNDIFYIARMGQPAYKWQRAAK